MISHTTIILMFSKTIVENFLKIEQLVCDCLSHYTGYEEQFLVHLLKNVFTCRQYQLDHLLQFMVTGTSFCTPFLLFYVIFALFILEFIIQYLIQMCLVLFVPALYTIAGLFSLPYTDEHLVCYSFIGTYFILQCLRV